MLKVAGKPVMDYVMDDVAKLTGVEQVVYITGHLKEKVEAHAKSAYSFPGVYVEQKVQDGTAARWTWRGPTWTSPCSSSSWTRSSTRPLGGGDQRG